MLRESYFGRRSDETKKKWAPRLRRSEKSKVKGPRQLRRKVASAQVGSALATLLHNCRALISAHLRVSRLCRADNSQTGLGPALAPVRVFKVTQPVMTHTEFEELSLYLRLAQLARLELRLREKRKTK